jgi:hypothetical protein
MDYRNIIMGGGGIFWGEGELGFGVGLSKIPDKIIIPEAEYYHHKLIISFDNILAKATIFVCYF